MALIWSIQMCNISLVCSVIDLARFFLAHQNASICLSRSLLDGIMHEGCVSDCAYTPHWMCTTRFMCHICRGTLQNFQLLKGGYPSPIAQVRYALGMRARMGLLGIPDVWASSTASRLAAHILACIRTRIRQHRAPEAALRRADNTNIREYQEDGNPNRGC